MQSSSSSLISPSLCLSPAGGHMTGCLSMTPSPYCPPVVIFTSQNQYVWLSITSLVFLQVHSGVLFFESSDFQTSFEEFAVARIQTEMCSLLFRSAVKQNISIGYYWNSGKFSSGSSQTMIDVCFVKSRLESQLRLVLMTFISVQPLQDDS